MRRASQPVEILLGFAAGMFAAFFVQQPLIWILDQLHVTSEPVYSRALTLPLGVEYVWSRVFWGGVFGLILAAFGTRYQFGFLYIVAASLFTFILRTLADWFVGPVLERTTALWTVRGILTPLVANAIWVPTTSVLVIALSLMMGTWGSKAPSDLIRHE
jgi:hypothetical protein